MNVCDGLPHRIKGNTFIFSNINDHTGRLVGEKFTIYNKDGTKLELPYCEK